MTRALLGLLATLVLLLTACSDLDPASFTAEVDGTLTPAHEATGVDVNTDVSIEFIDPLSGEIAFEDVDATFTVTPEGGETPVAADTAFAQDEDFFTTWTLTPDEALAHATTYEAHIAVVSGLVTDEGEELAGDMTWTFTTADAPDGDGDGVPDGEDNCPEVSNPDQGDMDGDGTGNACDDDRDGDGLPNDEDPFPGDADGDGDGVPDGEDTCPTVANPDQDPGACTDSDGDGVDDAADNCPDVHNPEQDDWNDNGVGDACEDSDGDGINDDEDPFPGDEDGDGDGVNDGEDPQPEVPGAAPSIDVFSADPIVLTGTDDSILTWATSPHHDDPEIDEEFAVDLDGTSVDPSGSTTVTPSADTTYTLTASNIYGSSDASVTVLLDSDDDGLPDVDDPYPDDPDGDGDGVDDPNDPDPTTPGYAPAITFTADPETVSDSNGSTLSWEVVREHAGTEIDEELAIAIDNDIGEVSATGSTHVEVSEDVVYTLTASNIYGTNTADVAIDFADDDGDGIPDDEDDGYDGDPDENPACDEEELDGALCITYDQDASTFYYDTDVKQGDPIVENPPRIVNGAEPYDFWFEASNADGFFELQDDGTIVRGSSGQGSDFQDWELRVYVEDATGKVASIVLKFEMDD